MKRAIVAQPPGAMAERLIAAASAAGAKPYPVISLEAAFDALESESTDSLVIGPDLICDVTFELAEHALSAAGATVVLIVSQPEALLMRRALRAGVVDVVDSEETIDEVTAAVQRALSASERMRPSAAPADESHVERGKVITVFSTKGGVGKTVLATNVAVALASSTGKRVALVDLDLEFGDVGIMLGIRPQHTIFDASQVIDRLDAAMLEGFMEQHSSGARVLLAPVRPEEAESVSSARVSKIIDLIRTEYDYVVLDTCPSFSEVLLAALDRTDELLVVTMMDVASIKNTRISLHKLRQLGYDKGQIRLVLNRSDSKVLLATSEVEEAVGGSISAHIPSDRIVPRSVNKGIPVVIEAPRTDVAKSMVSLAKQAAGPVEREAGNVA